MHSLVENDPRHERAAVLQHLRGALPWFGVADLPWQARRIFRRLANGADYPAVRIGIGSWKRGDQLTLAARRLPWRCPRRGASLRSAPASETRRTSSTPP
jgi:hypothetical protein